MHVKSRRGFMVNRDGGKRGQEGVNDSSYPPKIYNTPYEKCFVYSLGPSLIPILFKIIIGYMGSM